jgi:hypothetical protein
MCSLLLAAGLVTAAAAQAFAQASPSPSSSAKIGPPVLGAGGWGKYMAIVLLGMTALIVLALLAGLAIQGPGFRKAEGDAE